jgi:hypothetical protein
MPIPALAPDVSPSRDRPGVGVGTGLVDTGVVDTAEAVGDASEEAVLGITVLQVVGVGATLLMNCHCILLPLLLSLKMAWQKTSSLPLYCA